MTPDNLDAIYGLASLQQGLLFHSLSHPRSGAYIEQIQCVLTGEVDLPVFRQTWQMLMQRHDPLRTSFHWEGLSAPVQSVWKTLPLPWQELDWRGRTDADIATEYAQLLTDDRRRGFNLAQPPLMRFLLIQVRDGVYRFVWTHHHLLVDGWSVHRLLRELVYIYEQLKAGHAIDLPPVTPYREYIRWLQQQPRTEAETYWRACLKGIDAPTPVPGARPSSDDALEMDDVYADARRMLDERLSAQVQQFAQQHRITVNTVVLGAWALLQRRYAPGDDVLFGVTVAGRPGALPDVDRMVGLFINTLPARVTVRLRAPVLRWLGELQIAQAEARQYETTPLVDVQGWSDVPRGSALFDTIFVFENYPDQTEPTRAGDLKIEQPTSYEPTHFALTVTVKPGRQIGVQLGYARRRFDVDTIDRLLDQYARLLAGLVADPARPLGRIPLVDAEAQRAWVMDWNRTARAVDAAPVAERIAAQAVAQPGAIAIEDGDATLTYAALDRQTRQLAGQLRAMGVGRETVVAVCLEPSPALIVGLLAVLQAGAAYLALDPADPPERLTFLLEDSHAALLLTRQAYADRVSAVRIATLALDEERWEPSASAMPALPAAASSRTADLACVSYTSESTRGVLVTHGALCNYVARATTQYGVTVGTRTLLHAAVSVDLAASLWARLGAGGTVVIGEGPTHKDGTTETVVGSSISEASHWPTTGGAPIGRPSANTQLYVLDETLTPVPVGVPGEVYIGGAGVARGYLRAPALTATRFVPDPFGGGGGRLYRTGDRACYRADGELDALGRVDTQVKLRGYRIEPAAAPQAWAAPRTALEQRLAAIWADILQVERVGLHDNFFDLGGHSLTLVTALSQLRSKLRLDLSITDLFQYPTIAALAQFVEAGPELAATVAGAEKRIALRAGLNAV